METGAQAGATFAYKIPDQQDRQHFASIVGGEWLRDDLPSREAAGHDQTEDLLFLPALVLLPGTPEQVAAILQHCRREHIALTVRGAGTGLAGGAIPVQGGVVLSMQRFNRILDIDLQNHQVTVEAGVITEQLQQEVLKQGLYYPPDPSSRGSCFIGGNIGTNAGGPRAVKYGVVRDYVLNLEIVLSDGTIAWTGANTLKFSSGYNLTQLIVGSEGTLAVVTKAVLRLIVAPRFNKLLWIPFADPYLAIEMVNRVFLAGIQPSALEFMERSAIDFTLQYLENSFIRPRAGEAAYLMIELDGQEEAGLLRDCERIAALCEAAGNSLEIILADTDADNVEIWKLRRAIGWAVKSHSIYKEEDTVVPRALLPRLLAKVKEIGALYGFQSICYGHAGDGNLHVNIIRAEATQEQWEKELPKAIARIFEYVVSVGGAISGEHGIGYVQKSYLPIQFSEHHLSWMRGIKAVFDPTGILNPEKIFEPGD